jgi:hypothetical protein
MAMCTSSDDTDYHKEDMYGESFTRYENMLRTWFVAYGIGGPVLFMTQDSLRRALAASPNARLIVIFFLSGLLVEVLENFLYKMCMWYLYREAAKENNSPRMYTFSKWVENHNFIDIMFDLLTIAFFTAATIKVFPIIIN